MHFANLFIFLTQPSTVLSGDKAKRLCMGSKQRVDSIPNAVSDSAASIHASSILSCSDSASVLCEILCISLTHRAKSELQGIQTFTSMHILPVAH